MAEWSSQHSHTLIMELRGLLPCPPLEHSTVAIQTACVSYHTKGIYFQTEQKKKNPKHLLSFQDLKGLMQEIKNNKIKCVKF